MATRRRTIAILALIACCATGIGIAWLMSDTMWRWAITAGIPLRNPSRAISRIKALGGNVEPYTREGSIFGYGVDLSNTAVSDEDLWALDDLDGGTFDLNMGGTAITDKGVRILTELSGRHMWWSLNLSSTMITDDAFESIQRLSPGSLNLSHTKITDAGFYWLKSLSTKHIDVSATRVGDDGLRQIAALFASQTPFQHELNLSESAVTDAGLVHLQGLDFDKLGLSRTTVSDLGIAHLEKAKRIGELDLADTQITDKGAEAFPHINSLYGLVISRTQISDAALMHIKQMPDLCGLDVSGTRVTKAGVQDLQSALPKLRRVDGP
jgi:internalin A